MNELSWWPEVIPKWAEEIGQDECGVLARFRLDEVVCVMRWIPAGVLLMGSPEDEQGRFEDEGPQHEVAITKGYWLGEVPVTQELWKEVMGENPSHFKGSRKPVEKVSWDDCVGYIEKLNERLAASGGMRFRLPTEAEWEYGCRAGSEGKYSGGMELEELGWYRENSNSETHEVGGKERNAFGLYDVHGNIWEWCDDGQRDYKEEACENPMGPQGAARRVVRGGSYWLDAQRCRAACRPAFRRGARYDDLGFRLAAGQEPEGVKAEPELP